MPMTFSADVVTAVLHHMNDDHVDDSLLIVRTFGAPLAMSATMTGFDGAGGIWSVALPDGHTEELRVPWLGGEIADRPAVRREVVALYDAACAALGTAPRAHDETEAQG